MRLLFAGLTAVAVLQPADIQYRKRPDWLPFGFVLRVAEAHSWYPIACCSQRDCRPVGAEDMEEIAGGAWKHRPSGLIFSRDKVRPSQDRHFHICVSEHTNAPLCAFTLQGS